MQELSTASMRSVLSLTRSRPAPCEPRQHRERYIRALQATTSRSQWSPIIAYGDGLPKRSFEASFPFAKQNW